MRDLPSSRYFRVFICLLLVCCLVIQMTPVGVQASTAAIPTGMVYTGDVATGILSILFQMAMGIVFTDLTYQTIVSCGQSLKKGMNDFYVNDVTSKDIVNVWIEPIQIDLRDPEDIPEDVNRNINLPLLTGDAEKVKAALRKVAALLMKGEGVEVEGEAAPEGYAYYNGVSLPLSPEYDETKYCYSMILFFNENYYYFAGSSPFRLYSPNNGLSWMFSSVNEGDFLSYRFSSSCSSWNSYSYSIGPASGPSDSYALIWSSHDIYKYDELKDSNLLYASASPAPLTHEKTIVYPSTYVGDMPLKIQQGEADEEDIPVPNEIDFSKIFEGQTDAVEALNKVATQLADGTMTHDQYIEMITPETSTDSGSGDNTETGSGDGSGGSTTSPVTDIAPYGLELTDYFPFCIPFDLYDFFAALAAEPVAPEFHWEFQDTFGRTYNIDVDLSPWDSLAQLFRRLQLLLFIVGLASASRKFIKW